MKLGGEDGEEDLQNVDQVNHYRFNYSTALFLIMAEKYSYYFPYGGTHGADPGKDATWMHTFPIFQKKLGPPKGPAVQDGYKYYREFEHCKVELDIEKERGILTWGRIRRSNFTDLRGSVAPHLSINVRGRSFLFVPWRINVPQSRWRPK